MLSHDTKAVFGISRAYKSVEVLAARGDFYGLYAKKSFERDNLVFEGHQVKAAFCSVLAMGMLGTYYGRDIIKNRNTIQIQTGNLLLAEHKTPNDLRLRRALGYGSSVQMPDRYIGLHYSGSHDTAGRLDVELATAARKLFAIKADPPSMVVGISHRDLISTVARRYDLDTYEVTGYSSPFTQDALAIADVARSLRGRGPCPDRNMYAVAMPTEEFIDRFAFSTHYRGQSA